MAIEIKHRYTGEVLYTYEPTAEQQSSGLAMLAALEAAVRSHADLRGAYLGGADLGGGIKLIGERPIVAINPVGSRGDYFYGYVTDHGLMLRAGCFFGTADEFLAELERKHGDNEHGREYRAALNFIRVHAGTWTPDAVTKDAVVKEVA